MPNRVLFETVCTSQSLALLSDGAERLLMRLWTKCDNHGRFEADPELVLVACFPRQLATKSIEQIAEQLDEIQRAETVEFYTVNEKLYGWHPNWQRHNRLRAQTSRFPEPPRQRQAVSMKLVVAQRKRARQAALFLNRDTEVIELNGAEIRIEKRLGGELG